MPLGPKWYTAPHSRYGQFQQKKFCSIGSLVFRTPDPRAAAIFVGPHPGVRLHGSVAITRRVNHQLQEGQLDVGGQSPELRSGPG